MIKQHNHKPSDEHDEYMWKCMEKKGKYNNNNKRENDLKSKVKEED